MTGSDGNGTAREFYPDRVSLEGLRRAAAGCRACPLWKRGTQTVFGVGLVRSRLMLVGEQPGDEEDLAGRPFVGPAGRELDAALEEAGIDRSEAYVTNVVKHFKWYPRGKRRMHEKPDAREINACLPWLEGELEVVEPEVLMCLGATASRALLGSSFRVTRQRGEWIDSEWAPKVTATLHPSAILRIPDDGMRREERERWIDDFRKVAEMLDGSSGT